MHKRNLLRLTAAALVGLAGVTVPATAAFADPSGCSKRINSWGQNAGGNLFGNFSGNCSSSGTRTLNGEIKQDLNLRPDPVTLKGADVDSRIFLVNLQGCDEGQTATYYARTFYSGYTDYKDSNKEEYDVC